MATSLLAAAGSSGSLSIALIGKTGVGKSCLGNHLIGRPQFPVSNSFRSCTSSCRRETATVDGRQIAVVDTPGAMDTNDEAGAMREMLKLISFSPGGFNAFLLVLSAADRFTNEQDEAVAQLRRSFGDDFLQFAVIVFTNGDRFDNDESELKAALQEAPPKMKELVQKCEWRVTLVDNREGCDAELRKRQRRRLLQMVEQLSSSRGVYTNEMFQLVQKLERMKEKAAAEAEANREEKKKEIAVDVIKFLAGLVQVAGPIAKEFICFYLNRSKDSQLSELVKLLEMAVRKGVK